MFQGLRRDAEDCAETGPSVKPCAWMVTNHVLELNQLDAIGVGLSAALHRLTRARDHAPWARGPHAEVGGERAPRASRSLAGET